MMIMMIMMKIMTTTTMIPTRMPVLYLLQARFMLEKSPLPEMSSTWKVWMERLSSTWLLMNSCNSWPGKPREHEASALPALCLFATWTVTGEAKHMFLFVSKLDTFEHCYSARAVF